MSFVTLLGLTVDTKPVTAFEAGGQIYLIAPDGFPLLSFASISFNIDPDANYTLTTFAFCFCRGTGILTPTGPVKIENLAIGDEVVTQSGENKKILWIGSRKLSSKELEKIQT